MYKARDAFCLAKFYGLKFWETFYVKQNVSFSSQWKNYSFIAQSFAKSCVMLMT